MISCAKQESGPEFIRLIDQLNENNIVSSPLVELEDQFDRIKQDWSGQDVVSFDFKQQKCWALSTEFPILGTEETKKPEGMTIFKDGQEIEFVQNASAQTFAWGFLKGERDILPRKILPAKRRDEGIILHGKDFLETEIVLPQSQVVYDHDD